MLMRAGMVGVVVAAAAALAGCGGQTRSAAPDHAQVVAAFSGSPAPLAALHAQPSRLLGGGVHSFKTLLAGLRGYPVVVNEWGSWCTDCVSEFPAFQRAAVAYGRRVAFVGVDVEDAGASAASFLHRFPVTYPSYVDPKQHIAQMLEASGYYPQTVYISRRGTVLYDHPGPYTSVSMLERDVRRYGLQ
jgi:cytochrome c biogenesis protein CcmG, thiol:disulfide interchange protein DsbE